MERIKAIIFDVGGVFRDSQDLIYLVFEQAFANFGIKGINTFTYNDKIRLGIKFEKENIYRLRGFESFNDVSNATKAIYVTKGENLEQYLSDLQGDSSS